MKRSSLSLGIFLNQIRANALKLSGFVFVFGIVKMNAFTAALFLSNFVESVADYGLFEYALSLGLMIAVPINLGLQGAYPYFNLKLGKDGFRSVFYFHSLLVSGTLLSVFFLDQFFFHLIAPKIFLALLIGLIIAKQVMMSSILKSHEVLFKAVFLDGGLFLVLNGYNFWLYSSGEAFKMEVLQGIFVTYLFVLLGLHTTLFLKTKKDFSLKRYMEALGFGRHLVVSAFLIICLTGSTRLFIEYFLGMESVGYYTFYFRLAAVTVMMHQIVNIVFFKKMYKAPPEILDRYFSAFLGLVFFTGLAIWWILPSLIQGYLTILDNTYSTYNALYFILTFQMIFWISLALNENIIYRERLSSRMNRWFFLVFISMAGLMVLANSLGYLNIFSIAILSMLGIFAGCEMQFYLLRKKGNDFRNTRRLNIAFLGIFFICYFLFF